MDWLKLGKEYIKAVYCYPAYLTYMWSTSREMLEWMKHMSFLPLETASQVKQGCMEVRKQQLELDMEQQTSSK